MIVCDKVCLVFSSLMSQSSLVHESARHKIIDHWILFGGSVFRQIKGVQRKPLSLSIDSQVSSALYNPYATILNSRTLHSFITKAVIDSMRVNGDGYVLIKLSLQKQSSTRGL